MAILIASHTFEGQTTRVADRVAEVLRGHGDDVDVRELGDAPLPTRTTGSWSATPSASATTATR